MDSDFDAFEMAQVYRDGEAERAELSPAPVPFPEEYWHGHAASCLSLIEDGAPTSKGNRVDPFPSADEQDSCSGLRAFEQEGDETPEVTVRQRKAARS
jgi:hypothetical protein